VHASACGFRLEIVVPSVLTSCFASLDAAVILTIMRKRYRFIPILRLKL